MSWFTASSVLIKTQRGGGGREQNKLLEREQAILTEVNYDSDYNGRQYSN
jgi:hypothetical protein